MTVTARLYAIDNPTVELGDPITDITGAAWSQVLNQPGGFEFRIHPDDIDLARITHDRIVRLEADGRTAAYLLEKAGRIHASSNEDAGKYVRPHGRSVEAILEDSRLLPEGGLGRAGRIRWFGPQALAFNDSSWVAPETHGTQDDHVLAWSGQYPEEWPDPDAHLIWIPGNGADADPGDVHFRATFEVVGDPVDIGAWATADDEFDCWIAHELAMSSRGPYKWQQTFEWSDLLEPGVYQVYIRGHNLERPTPTDNPGWVLFTLGTLDADGELDEVLLRSDTTNWVADPYPDQPPGMTPGEIMIAILDEAHGRGELAAVTADVTAALDSAGAAWPFTLQQGFRCGDSYLTVAEKLAGLGVDFHITPGLAWQAWPARGVDRTAELTFAYGDNIISDGGEQLRDFAHENALLLRTHSGYHEAEDSGSLASRRRRVGFVELGSAWDEDATAEAVDETFVETAGDYDDGLLDVVDPGAAEPGDVVSAPGWDGAGTPRRVLSVEGRQDGEKIGWTVLVE